MEVNLKQEREKAGLTQVELAAKVGIAAANLSAMESGRRPVSDKLLQRLRRSMRRPSEVLVQRRDEVRRIIAESGARDPRVFGSVARGEDRPGSDLDIIVTVPPEAAWRFGSLRPRLMELLGMDVDVVSEDGLRGRYRRVLDEAVPL